MVRSLWKGQLWVHDEQTSPSRGERRNGQPALQSIGWRPHFIPSDRRACRDGTGVAADGAINQAEAEFLQKWLAANVDISDQPLVRILYRRVDEFLADGVLDPDECADLLDTLNRFSSRDFELGEVLKATSLPLCDPAPELAFDGWLYCFTGTFNYGQRKHCEQAVVERGGQCAGLSMRTRVLVIGTYATDSWKHSAFGNKIIKACDWRDAGAPISIVSEEHWTQHL